MSSPHLRVIIVHINDLFAFCDDLLMHKDHVDQCFEPLQKKFGHTLKEIISQTDKNLRMFLKTD